MIIQKKFNRVQWLGGISLFLTLLMSAVAPASFAEPRGYVAQGDPASDDVVFLVHLGHVQAAIGRMSSYDKEEGMPNPFTPRVMEEYAAIDAVLSDRGRAQFTLEPLLSEVASADSFATVMDTDRSKRMAQNAIQTKLRDLTLRVDGVVTEIFPSPHASALTISALFREAGEMLQTGLASDGKILDITKHRNAVQLMDASLRLRVNKVSACSRSKNAIDQLKSRGPMGDLLDRFIIVSAEGTVEGTADDAFDAADKLEQLGLSLPDDDAQICN